MGRTSARPSGRGRGRQALARGRQELGIRTLFGIHHDLPGRNLGCSTHTSGAWHHWRPRTASFTSTLKLNLLNRFLFIPETRILITLHTSYKKWVASVLKVLLDWRSKEGSVTIDHSYPIRKGAKWEGPRMGLGKSCCVIWSFLTQPRVNKVIYEYSLETRPFGRIDRIGRHTKTGFPSGNQPWPLGRSVQNAIL